MNLERMSYKNYVWKNNPKKLSIEEEKNIKDYAIPFAPNLLQNLGRGKRIVKGVGEFFGDNFLDEYKELRALYLSNEEGYLKLPNTQPFLASFKYLNMIGNAAENCLTYTFEFWEKIEEPQNTIIDLSNKYYIANEGQNLWDIAYKYNMSVSSLMDLNPEIKRPDYLAKGQKVVLR